MLNICCHVDALSYIFIEMAIMSLGYTAFPLSPRNLPVVTAHLLEKTGVSQLYASEDAAMQGSAKAAAKLLEEKGLHVGLLPMIKPEEWVSLPAGVEPFSPVDIADTDVTVILHSSGSYYPPLLRRAELTSIRNHRFPEANSYHPPRTDQPVEHPMCADSLHMPDMRAAV